MDFLSTAVVAKLNPVITSDERYLREYAYALQVWASKSDALGKPIVANTLRTRAYYLRTLIK